MRNLALGILLVTAIFALYLQRLLLPSVGLFHDDGVYLVTAKALATGQGYRIISLPTAIVQTKYPILFPALLALVWKAFPAFPSNLLLLKLVPFLAALAWFVLVYRFYRDEHLPQRPAVALTLVLTLVPWVLFLSSTLLSETLCFALTLAGLIVIRMFERSPVFGRYLPFWAGVLAGAATLTRMNAIALIAAGTLALFRKSKPAAGVFLATSLAITLPWFAWTHENTASRGSDAYYTAQNYGSWNVVFNYAPDQKLNIVLTNLAAAIGAFGTLFEYRLALVALLIAAALTVGFILDIRRAGFNVVHIFCIAYLGLTLLWAWLPLRFLVLLTPMCLLFAYRFISALREKTGWSWLPASALLLASPMVAEDIHQFRHSLETGAVASPGTPDNPPLKWREYAKIGNWLHSNAPSGAVVMGTLDPVYYLYSGHASVRSFSTDPYFLFYSPNRSEDSLGTASDLIHNLKAHQATVFVSTPFSERQALKKVTDGALSLAPEAFHLALQLPDPDYRVYFVDPAKLSLVTDFP